MTTEKGYSLSTKLSVVMLQVFQTRFEKNPHRHEGIQWADVQNRLETFPGKLMSLNKMEITGGEPDCVGFDPENAEYIFMDCSPESPVGRRSLCYDPCALASRKKNKPRHSATGMAAEMGIELLTELDYRALQRLGIFDTKTSSWIKTPADIRQKGGALFCDSRYGHVFVYHNGADSYYASRGFRSVLRI